MDIEKETQSAFEYFQTGNFQAAEELLRRILVIHPYNPGIHNNLGLILYDKGQIEEAIKHFQRAIILEPGLADAYYNLGIGFERKGQLDKAITCYQKTIELNPSSADAYNNLGLILQEKGQLDKAITCYQKTIELNPSLADAYNNLGTALQEKGQLDEAITSYQRVLQLDPNYIVAYNNLGLALQEKGQLDEAITSYQRALQLNPNDAYTHLNMSLTFLLAGNYKEGWKEFEWRQKLDEHFKHNFLQPLWDGSNITGWTILLYTEQGLGDAIQFIRYAPLVAEYGARVFIECRKELKALFKNVGGVYKVIAHGEQLPEFDVHYPLMSLPVIFSTTLESIPSNVPYIRADPILVQKWREKIHQENSHLRIGLVWASGPGGLSKRKSLNLNILSPLAQLNNISFYSLQKGEVAKQTKCPPIGMRLFDYTEEIDDFSDTAALIENLDLVISVDTAVAHLAGALGKPIWTLISFEPVWQWMLQREDNQWYPTMRLFRQPSPGDWNSVIAEVSKELQKKMIIKS
jgi:tetratricopeptide (TPR) repeat protein